MTPKELVQSLYAAYSTGDPQRIRSLLHEDVVWVAPPGNATQVALGLGRPEHAGPPDGSNNLDRDAIVRFMAYNFARFFGSARNEFRAMAAEGDLVFVEHRLSATLPNGRHYVNDYCFAYEVRNGKIFRIREYMDTRGGWVQVFGTDAAEQVIEFIAD